METQNENNFTILQALSGQETTRVPFWFMRQAGRYLPEYRELRATAGGFLNLVYNPDQASEVTVQPIRRFGMSAAILFSDILVIPQALGQDLKFETGEGPRLNALENLSDVEKLNPENIDQTLSPVYETIKQTRSKLKTEGFSDTALIGFAGSPWTVACYMIDGRGKTGFKQAKKWITETPERYKKLNDILVTATSHYLIQQIKAGAQAIQLFDSWSGLLSGDDFDRWVIEPTNQIIKNVRAVYPDILIIGFAREAGDKAIDYAKTLDIQGIGMDYSMEPMWARDNLQNILTVQGNLDPQILLEGGDNLHKQANHILETFVIRKFCLRVAIIFISKPIIF